MNHLEGIGSSGKNKRVKPQRTWIQRINEVTEKRGFKWKAGGSRQKEMKYKV